MDIIMRGKTIYLAKTQIIDLSKILKIEKSNIQFVNQYSRKRHIKLIKSKNDLHISIQRNDNKCLVGYMILLNINNANKQLELRRIAISEKGRGYGRESIRLIKELCFMELKFHKLWFDVYCDNIVALKLYISEGFKRDGVLRDNAKIKNGYRSQYLFSILEEEYRAFINVNMNRYVNNINKSNS